VARTLVLDLDGTLVDSVPDLAASLNRVLAARGLAPFTPAETAPMVGDGARTLVARAFAARNAPPPGDADVAAYLADYAANLLHATTLYPGVVPTLRVMAGQGWRFAVCTNKPEAHARSLLAALGLGDRFAAIGGGDSFAARKPDPAHLLATLRAAGGEAGRAVMVGDHRNDLEAARGACMPCIFAAWGYGPVSVGARAAAVAARFADLPAIADRLLPC
jgi:phosphoglycolate phosphatase